MDIVRERRLTKVVLLGVFSDEVPTLCNLLEEKFDGLLVRLDGLQGPGVLDERKDVAHSSR